MPYMVVKKNDRWCVYKEGADGKPTGDPLGCHDTETEAVTQQRALYANEPGKAMSDEWPEAEKTLVNYGGEIKDMGDGKIGGYLVRFTTENDPDLENDFFAKDTDFDLDLPGQSTVYYAHGLDPTLKHRKFGKAALRMDDFGVWAETQLALRDEYEKFLLEMARQGKLGWSSGTASHLVEREPQPNGTSKIARWPLGLDASMTLTPAEFRNSIVPLKSLPPVFSLVEAAETASTEQAVETKNCNCPEKSGKETFTMDEQTKNEILEIIQTALKAIAPVQGEDKTQETKEGGLALTAPNVKRVTTLGFKDEPVKVFLRYIAKGDNEAARAVLTPDRGETKAAMQGQTDAEGGYYVPDDFYPSIIEKRDLISFIRKTSTQFIPTVRDRILVPAEATAATKFVVTAEEGAYDENEPTAGQVPITVHKLTKMLKISEELLDDAVPGFERYIANALGRAMGLAENYYFSIGTGTGMPQGAVTAATQGGATTAGATAITVAEFMALLGSLGAGYYVDGEIALLMKNATKFYLQGLTGNPFVFIQTPQGGDFKGIPAYICDDMGGVASAQKSILFANWSLYAVAERQGLVISRNPWLYQANGQVGLFCKFREGGAALQTDAFKYLLQAT